MTLQLRLFHSLFGKAILAGAALSGFFLFAGAPAASAYGGSDCDRNLGKTEYRYNQAVERFGPYSSQARHWAHERNEAYAKAARCRREWREHHRDRDDYRR